MQVMAHERLTDRVNIPLDVAGAYMAVQAVKAIEMGGKYIGPAICKVRMDQNLLSSADLDCILLSTHRIFPHETYSILHNCS